MLKHAALAVAIFLCLSHIAEAQNSQWAHRRALVIGWDGARGDVVNHAALDLGKSPNLKSLMMNGVYTECTSATDDRCAKAQSGPRLKNGHKWLTGPGWASVLTGVDANIHGVQNNYPSSLQRFSVSTKEHPTFMMRAKALGLKTAAAGVGAFMTSRHGNSTSYGVIDYECGNHLFIPNVNADATKSCNLDNRLALESGDSKRDQKLTSWLLDQIRDDSIDITMGVFDQVDAAGHLHGFSENEGYLKAITVADGQLGQIIMAINQRVENTNEEWLVTLTSDHGGHKIFFGGLHSSRPFEDEVVPFVVATFGRSTERNLMLRAPVRTMDTHPTVMFWFNQPSVNMESKVQGL